LSVGFSLLACALVVYTEFERCMPAGVGTAWFCRWLVRAGVGVGLELISVVDDCRVAAPRLSSLPLPALGCLAMRLHRSVLKRPSGLAWAAVCSFGVLAAGADALAQALTPEAWEWPGTPADLIRAVTQGAFQAMVRDFKAPYGIARLPSVKVTNQCRRTAYSPQTATVCITAGMTQALARIGDGALAYVVAHELAHHLQHAIPQITRGFTSRTQLELQADCLAGFLLVRNRQVTFTETDVVEAFKAASKLGDRTYDHFDHHGTGEMRQLAIRSGVRFGLTNQRDNYFPLFCGLNAGGAKNGVGG
jgi:hypothetical protein